MRKLREKLPGQQFNVFLFLAVFCVFLFTLGFVFSPISEIIPGLVKIWTSPAILLSDYFSLTNVGVAFINAALTTTLGLVLCTIFNEEIDGTVISVLFIVAGFSLFGKNLANGLPILLGGFLHSLYKKEKFGKYVVVSLFGFTMGPIVSEFYNMNGLPTWLGIVLGILAGVFIGFSLPLFTPITREIHHGYNLYNVGCVSGFLTIIFVSVMKVLNHEFTIGIHLVGSHYNVLYWILLGFCVLLILIGTILNKDNFKKGLFLSKESGKTPTDFTKSAGLGPTFVNMGLVGLLLIGFCALSHVDLCGPVVGAIITVIGFASIGNTFINVLWICIGAYLGQLFKFWDFSVDHGAVVGAIFATCVAPLGGEVGPLFGILSGMLHIFIVKNVSTVHAGLTLYSNGFAGLFDIVILYPFVKLFKENKILKKLLFNK